jgi:hypothetical protein
MNDQAQVQCEPTFDIDAESFQNRSVPRSAEGMRSNRSSPTTLCGA